MFRGILWCVTVVFDLDDLLSAVCRRRGSGSDFALASCSATL